MIKPQSSDYIEQQRHDYSLYVMRSRAIPSIKDGLKAGQRRVLWMARDGQKYKSASLAGSTLPIHPHDSPEGSINTLAAPYGNNIPLFTGKGALGTLINPTAYGASRYTSVSTSKFTNDVVFRDIEVIPMVENYDGTLMEPEHFLPLVPICLINPAEGIAVGYATNIMPRAPDDIIIGQITHLKGGKNIGNPNPKFRPLNTESYHSEVQASGRTAYYFNGDIERKDTSTIRITKLPYGQTHLAVVNKLEALLESGTVVDYTDNSNNVIDIEVKFRRGVLKDVEDTELYRMLGLNIRHIENLNVLDFTGQAIWSTNPVDVIRKFTDWRLTFYVKRYQRLLNILNIDVQRLLDVILAIDKNIGQHATKVATKVELTELLQTIGIVDVQYIASLPIYRFTQEEYNKTKKQLDEAIKLQQEYESIISSRDKQKAIYISELQDILTQYNKGVYSSN